MRAQAHSESVGSCQAVGLMFGHQYVLVSPLPPSLQGAEP